MSSSFSWASLLQTCLVLVVALCILIPSDVTGAPSHLSRDKRVPKIYRVGYIFGKRSDSAIGSSKLFDAISRRLMSLSDITEMLQNEPEILQQAISHLDKNDDGYITVSDLL